MAALAVRRIAAIEAKLGTGTGRAGWLDLLLVLNRPEGDARRTRSEHRLRTRGLPPVLDALLRAAATAGAAHG